MPDWKSIRAEFPALKRWTYLNTATFGQVPRCANDAVERHWRRRDEFGCVDFLDWYDDAERIRGAVARLIHAEPEDIAFVSSASAALSIVLAGIGISNGDNVVTLDEEFPNYLYLRAARRVAFGEFYAAIDARTRLAAFAEVNYITGFRPPLAEVSARLRERGVPLFVDGSQSTGALVMDLRQTPVDVLAVHGYKWLISPGGAGFMYISPALRKRLPPNIIGWRSHQDWRNVDNLHHGEPVFKESAEKYEGGGLPFPLIYALGASVHMVLEIGPEEIERRVLDLARQARGLLRGLGAEVEDSDSQIVAGRFPGRDASVLARSLREHGIVVAARHGNVRVSPHFYNDEDDLARLETGLRLAMR